MGSVRNHRIRALDHHSQWKLMEGNSVTLTYRQCKKLEEIVGSLVNQYHPESIICFGFQHNIKEVSNCFTQPVNDSHSHYFLLMITKDITRIEHEVQDHVNRHFDDLITILVHGVKTVTNAIGEGSRFFIRVCHYGFQLFSANGLRLNMDYPILSTAKTLASAERHYRHRYSMALGFMEAADTCFESQFYNNSIFMLHQAVEQACIALIRVYMAYRSDMHNLARLFNLCLCFSDEPAALFPRKTEEDLRLFQLLLKSYSEARYRDEYKVSSNDADILCTQVRELIKLTEILCNDKLGVYRQAAEQADEKTPDHLPVFPASFLS